MNRKLNKRSNKRSNKRINKRSNKRNNKRRSKNKSLKRINKINDGTTREQEQRFRDLFRNPPDYGETLNFSEISVEKEGPAAGAAGEKKYTNCRCRIWRTPPLIDNNYMMTISFLDTITNRQKHDTYKVSDIISWVQTPTH